MSELSLYRKYRPQTFSHLVGQDHVRVTLLNALSESRAVHAYLFCGPRGTGKTTTARLLAKALNCPNLTADSEPCEACDICRDITDGRLIDLIEIDAASNRRIDEIRELKDKIYFAPTRAKNKIYIIDEVHMLTKEAFNALLKMLEEPPDQVYFILATTEIHKIPDTIISRCQRFDFKRIDPKIIMTRLSYIAQKEGIEAEDSALEAVAYHVEGGLRDAIGLFEQLIKDKKLEYNHVKTILGIVGHETIQNFFNALQSHDSAAALNILQDLYREGQDFSEFTKEILQFVRKNLLQSLAEKKIDAIAEMMRMIDIFQNAYSQLKNTIIPQLPLEMAVIRFCEREVEIVDTSVLKKIPQESVVRATTATANSSTALPTQSVQTSPVKTESAEKAPVFSPTSTLQTADIHASWARVLEVLKTPSLKQSIRHVKNSSLHGNTLTLEFLSKFYMEKVLENSLRVELEHALEEIFSHPFKVSGVVQKMNLESIAPVSRAHSVDEAADIFGGEVIEE
ncbi:MAG: DNA polymerase III subunit gamma/tau [Patescibacteria group bacterium]